MQMFQAAVYALCSIASLICLVLLVRSYFRSRARILLWSSLGFIGLAANNLFVFADVILLPHIDFLPLRHVSNLAGIGVLLYAFIWEVD